MLTSLLALATLASPAPVWGVTLDDISGGTAIFDGLRLLRKRTTARIVFDPGAPVSYYAAPTHRIHLVANVMAEPVDSEPANTAMTVDEYRLRFQTYLDALRSDVDIWEIGNEVNGDWTGDSSREAAKIQAAYDEVKQRGRQAAVTLFYSDDYLGTDRDMATWAKTYLSEQVRNGTDYALVSFYPTSATGKHPDWAKIFGQLATVFPKAKLGFGELGLANADGSLNTNVSKNEALIRRYYGMAAPVSDRWIGGYFWWTFREDAIPRTRRLWKVFYDVLK